MPQWMQDLTSGWPMIRANLPAFFVILVLIIGAVWWVLDWRYSGILASKNGQIELQDRQLADYRQKLDGASPDQAKAKIEALEQTLLLTAGAKWEPLSKPQISVLASRLRDIQKCRVQVMYENALGKGLAQSIVDAFKEAGWDQAELLPGSGLGDGVVTGWGERGAALKSALDAAKDLHTWVKLPEMKAGGDLAIVGVGINSY
jgi:hypothetical protein